MIISMIAARAKNNVIGLNDDLPWHQPADFRFFKNTTMGHHLLMGRKTFEVLGKPLPNRISLIVTRKKDYKKKGVLVFNSIDDALNFAQEKKQGELFVIGGGEIYRTMLSRADRLYLTDINCKPEGDAFFPDFDESEWEIADEKPYKADEKNQYDMVFRRWDRKKP